MPNDDSKLIPADDASFDKWETLPEQKRNRITAYHIVKIYKGQDRINQQVEDNKQRICCVEDEVNSIKSEKKINRSAVGMIKSAARLVVLMGATATAAAFLVSLLKGCK